jgi:Ca2+-binding EF-hand superfamily protein/diadenosine tetraphosphatase ApaH/serine/threonine PP2A family protein phosphatase
MDSSKYDLKSVITVQTFARRYLAQRELIRHVFKDTWNHLDYHEEKMTIANEDSYGDISDIVFQTIPIRKPVTREEKFQIPSDYKGPHLKFPPTLEDVTHLLNHYKQNNLLHYKYTYELLNHIKKDLDAVPNVSSVHIPKGGRVIVVGDTHGQLTDLITLLDLGGLPSEKTSYIFNGDFVDRGFHGPEVLFMVYALRLAFPNNVFLNRGNHEARRMNEKYKFEDQIRQRYDSEIFELIQDTFKLLPLAATVEDKVFILHGGLFSFKDVTINEIQNINRKIGLPRHKNISTREQHIMEQTIWSDPTIEIEEWEPSDRGAGVRFGPAATKHFLKLNNLELVIRSHELVDEGYLSWHGDKLYTLFSASYYCGSNNNKGAIAVFEDKTNHRFKPEFKTFFADVATLQTKKISKKQRSQSLQQLRERIVEHRHELAIEFESLDTTSIGTVIKNEWVAVMNKVFQLPLNWAVLQPYLAKADDDGNINYTEFLTRYQINVDEEVVSRWRKQVISDICAKILSKFGSLKDAFASVDIDGSGKISYKEFSKILKEKDIGLSDEQIYDFMRSVDEDNDGSIDYGEFQNRFAVKFNRILKTEDKEFIQQATHEIGLLIASRGSELKETYKKIDQDETGQLTYKEFSNALKNMWNLEEKYTSEQRHKLFAYIDEDGSGKLSFDEFKKAFSFVDTAGDAWEEAALQRVLATLRKSQVQLRRAFKKCDTDNSGRIDVDEFKTILRAMNVVLPDKQKMSDVQIKKLHRMFDIDGDGFIDYEELNRSLEVVDKANMDASAKNVKEVSTSENDSRSDSSTVKKSDSKRVQK